MRSIRKAPRSQTLDPFLQDRALKRAGLFVRAELEVGLNIQQAPCGAGRFIDTAQRREARNERAVRKSNGVVACDRAVGPCHGFLILAIYIMCLREDALMPEQPCIERRQAKSLLGVLDS